MAHAAGVRAGAGGVASTEQQQSDDDDDDDDDAVAKYSHCIGINIYSTVLKSNIKPWCHPP
jgi:hypothetical protein